jgi:hypothetical protein
MPLVHTETERLHIEGGPPVIRVAFAATFGDFSEGNVYGNKMNGIMRQIVEQDRPAGLIIDLRQVDYCSGDWIAWGCFHRRLQTCRTCIVAGTIGRPSPSR